MKKVIKVGILEVRVPSSRWVINLTSEKLFHKIDALYDDNMNFVNRNYNLIEEFGDIVLDFGFNTYTGYARYSWVEYVPDDCDTSNGVVVNINNSDNCCGGSSNIITKTFANDTEFKIGELTNDTIFFNYSIKNSLNKIESGKLVIINETDLLVEAERISDDDLLPLTFTANKTGDVININITSSIVDDYTLKYNKIIF